MIFNQVNVTQQSRKGAPEARSFGGFLKSVRARDGAALEKVYGARKAALGEVAGGAAGGYLVPEEFTAELLRPLAQDGFIFPRATVLPMGSDTLRVPVLDATTAQSAGTPPWFGGVSFGWPGADGSAITETEPKFREADLTAWPLAGYVTLSNQLLADGGPAAEASLKTGFGKGIAWFAEYAFLQGTGLNQPLGVLNAAAKASVTRNTGGHVKMADVATMAGKLLPYCWANGPAGLPSAVWALHPTALADLFQIGTSTGVSWQPNEPHGAGLGNLFGFPVFVTDKLPALGTAGDVVLFDPSLYLIGRRVELLIDSSPHVRLTTNQTVWRVWARLAGRPLLDGTVTLADGTSGQSAYVVLT